MAAQNNKFLIVADDIYSDYKDSTKISGTLFELAMIKMFHLLIHTLVFYMENRDG